MAIFLSLKVFLKSQENVHVQIMTDNSTSVSYLNCMGGTKSVTLSNLALEIWRWCLRKAIHISAVHVAGLLNIFADPLSRFQLLSTEWMRCKRIFRQIVAVYGCPQIDLFASSQNHQLKTYCSWIADPKSLKNRCIHFHLGFQPSLPVSSISSNLQMPFKDNERQMQGNTNSPSVEIKTLLSNYFRDANGSPSSPPNQKRSLATSPIKSNSSSPDRQKKELQTSRLACVRESLRLNKVPERVSKIIFTSWRPGTEKHCQSAWCKFNSWCEERSINSISCPITEILSFLSDLYYNGMQYRTINLYRSAISMTHAPVDGCVTGSHLIVSRFMKGIFQLRMPTPKYLVTWDVSVVLGYLKTLSPKNSLSLKQSTVKLAMLVTLISFNRCDSLHKLGLRFHYFKRDTKTSGPSKVKEIFFPAFPQDRRLCVINYLKHYKEYTAEYRPKQSPSTPDPLFLSIVSPDKPISSTTFARWTKTVLKDSGIDTSTFGSHSTRSASTSAAQKLGVSVSDILKVADWSREATFIKFYHKPIAPAHPGIQVLSSC